MKNGLLLINLGTPDAPDVTSVRRYLREFLADKRVITLPAFLRYMLLYGVILPLRPKQSARAYQTIWTEKGSPLLLYGQALKSKLQKKLGYSWIVSLGMRYGTPSLENALQELQECQKIIILPLYPQYSSAATGSSIEKIMALVAQKDIIPSLSIIRDFHQHPAFINAQAKQIKPFIADHDFILFSYHGIPQNHLLKEECQALCKDACSQASPRNAGCYRAQCGRTTEMLAEKLGLAKENYTTSFQSRLGKTPWIQPYTDKILYELRALGIKKLAVACPSFVADCLETLEEIGIRAKGEWQKLGGHALTLIPSMNAEDEWVKAILEIISSSADPH
ncbi:ferrochelatase [Legionella londiniensis]|nr:ferrochelatase [Legionella londiniensis]